MPPMLDIGFDAASAISLGRRDHQEDAVAVDFPTGAGLGFAVISDGMGGHAAGDIASKIVVTEMVNRTFFAEVHLSSPSGDTSISARPSDAIALAVRCGAPLFALDELMDDQGQEPPVEPEEEAAEIIDEFKDFLEDLNPEDFA